MYLGISYFLFYVQNLVEIFKYKAELNFFSWHSKENTNNS